jgi:putative ABC transport system permease protein
MKRFGKLRALFSTRNEQPAVLPQTPPELHTAAGLAQMQGDAKSHWVTRELEHVWRDVRFSMRSLRRSPAFSLAVIGTLALCIGANTSIISVLYGLILKPLPFRDPGQMVDVYNMRPKAGQMHQAVSVAQYADYSANADLFENFALWTGWMFNIGEDGGTSRYVGMRVSPEYFSVIGVQPLMGRFFTKEDCVPGKDAVAVVTQSYWEKQFKADPAIVGREVRLSGRMFTIVGVVPRRFEEMSVAPVLMKPFEMVPEQRNPQWRMAPMASMYARIKPGVAHGLAMAQLNTLEQRFLEATAEPKLREFLVSGGHRVGLLQVRKQQTEPMRGGLLLLQAGALLVLLLGCVNVASLMLARANTRQAELAVRAALGASRGVLARQLLSEAALLTLAGAAVGLALAGAGLRVINLYTDKIVYGIPPVKLDGGVLGLTLLMAFVVALVIGSLPVLRIWRVESLQGALQSGSRGASRGGGRPGDEWLARGGAGRTCPDAVDRGWAADAQFCQSDGDQSRF